MEKYTRGLPTASVISSLHSSGFTHTAANYSRLKQVAYKLAKKYRLMHSYEDILQLVLLLACSKEKTFNPEKSSFPTYIYIIAEGRVINSYIRPRSTSALGKKIQDFSKEYKKEHGETPSVTTIAMHFGLSEDVVRSTFLYHSPETDFRLLQHSFSALQEDDPLSYIMEMDELLTKGFSVLSDLQRAIIDEVIIKDNSMEVVAAQLGIPVEILEEEYQEALSILKEYI